MGLGTRTYAYPGISSASLSPLQEEWQLLLENLIGGPHITGTVLHQILAQGDRNLLEGWGG